MHTALDMIPTKPHIKLDANSKLTDLPEKILVAGKFPHVVLFENQKIKAVVLSESLKKSIEKR